LMGGVSETRFELVSQTVLLLLLRAMPTAG